MRDSVKSELLCCCPTGLEKSTVLKKKKKVNKVGPWKPELLDFFFIIFISKAPAFFFLILQLCLGLYSLLYTLRLVFVVMACVGPVRWCATAHRKGPHIPNVLLPPFEAPHMNPTSAISFKTVRLATTQMQQSEAFGVKAWNEEKFSARDH